MEGKSFSLSPTLFLNFTYERPFYPFKEGNYRTNFLFQSYFCPFVSLEQVSFLFFLFFLSFFFFFVNVAKRKVRNSTHDTSQRIFEFFHNVFHIVSVYSLKIKNELLSQSVTWITLRRTVTNRKPIRIGHVGKESAIVGTMIIICMFIQTDNLAFLSRSIPGNYFFCRLLKHITSGLSEYRIRTVSLYVHSNEQRGLLCVLLP